MLPARGAGLLTPHLLLVLVHGDSIGGPRVPPLCALSLTVSKTLPLGLPSHILSYAHAPPEGGCELFRGAGGILVYR